MSLRTLPKAAESVETLDDVAALLRGIQMIAGQQPQDDFQDAILRLVDMAIDRVKEVSHV